MAKRNSACSGNCHKSGAVHPCVNTHPDEGMKSPPSHPPILGMLWVRSTHGLIRLAPAGIGKPISRMITNRDTTIPAPAESPMRMIEVGKIGACAPGGGSRRYRYAARASNSPQG